MNDEPFYDLVATEIQDGRLKPGLWTKAFADADGDQARARVLYIRQRVAQLEREAVEAARRVEENERLAVEADHQRQERVRQVEAHGKERGWLEELAAREREPAPHIPAAVILSFPVVVILLVLIKWLLHS